jgi:hypothetical protein
VQELAKDKLLILWLEDLPHGKRFLLYGEKKPLAVWEFVQDTCRARSEAVNPILFKF